MKHNVNLHSLFKELDMEDIQVEDYSSLYDQVSMKRIRSLTLHKIQEDRKEKSFHFKKALYKTALTACLLLCIGGATVFAATNDTVHETINSLLGISQDKILTVGESIKSNDYRLTVQEIASDSFTGIATVSVEALSAKAEASFLNENIISKLRLSPVGYGLRELDGLREGARRYYTFSFSVGNSRYMEEGLTFSMEGIRSKIKLPITQTVALTEKVINIPASDGYSVSYQKLFYSELGFTLAGRLENEDFNSENCRISIEFLDGSTCQFYSYQGAAGKIISNDTTPAKTGVLTDGSKTSSVSTNDTAPDTSTVDFDEEWFSGGSVSSIQSGKVTSIFSFSKRMDWNTVKSIEINKTTIPLP